jgi:hypothetical protein
MSNVNDPTAQEMLNWSTAREHTEKMMELAPDWRTTFIKDLDEILWRIIEIKNGPWKAKQLQLLDEASGPPIYIEVLPRRLPFGPLRRMARAVGFKELRHIFWLTRPVGHHSLRIDVSERLPSEKPDNGEQDRRIGRQISAERFGNAVLAYEAKGSGRDEALNNAAEKLNLPSRSKRSLERRFQEFQTLMRKRGFVGDHMPGTLGLPRFGLRALKAKPGRKKIPPT